MGKIHRDHIGVEPQYANIKDECYASFDRWGAVMLVPISRGGRIEGGFAVGPRRSKDLYEQAELDAIQSLCQQASQAIGRIEATERLRAREHEIGDLKRFFPPTIIDHGPDLPHGRA